MANPFSLLGRLTPSARSVSLRALLLTGDGMPVQQALSQSLRNPELPLSVKRQATDLVYSVLRADIRLDFVLRRLFPRADRLPALFLLAVKTAACALLFEEHAPAHAIVNGTVSDVRRLFGKGLDRVANGALRSLQRMGSAPLSPDFYRQKGESDDFPALCRFYSLPEEVARLWLAQEGRETAIALMKKSFARPCAGIRVNSSRPGWENLRRTLLESGALPLPGAAGESAGVYVPEGGLGLSGRMDLTSLQREGALSFQQGASLCVPYRGFSGTKPRYGTPAPALAAKPRLFLRRDAWSQRHRISPSAGCGTFLPSAPAWGSERLFSSSPTPPALLSRRLPETLFWMCPAQVSACSRGVLTYAGESRTLPRTLRCRGAFWQRQRPFPERAPLSSI